MPYDRELSRLQGELQELEDEIAQVEHCIWLMENSVLVPSGKQVSAIGRRVIVSKRTIDRLTQLKEHKEFKIRHHNQRIKESGVKY